MVDVVTMAKIHIIFVSLFAVFFPLVSLDLESTFIKLLTDPKVERNRGVMLQYLQ